MITLFCVRPRRYNVGNETIFLGVRHLLHEAFPEGVNIVQVPALATTGEDAMAGLQASTVHQVNLYGHGVLVGGGNLYENGGLTVDVNALDALRPPLMLFSLSHGRIYDNRHALVRRTDAMPHALVTALNTKAALSLARDDATLDFLRTLGFTHPVLGGCPTLLLSEIAMPSTSNTASVAGGTLLSIRSPQLMSIPLREQARLHGDLIRVIAALEADGHGPVRILCNDARDLAFASSLGDVECILPDDVYSYLEMLRLARLVVSFRLHAFVPCLSFGTPAVNISYDERSLSLVRTIGLGEWDIDFVRSHDVVADVRDRCARLNCLASLRDAAQPKWRELTTTMRDAMRSFAELVRAYATEGPSAT
ncbi:MAG: polysaccharide pyruvyl transferase family protein [bacterium]